MRKMREENFVKSVWGNFRLEKKYISAVAAGLFLVVIYLMASASNAQDMKTEMVSASISENHVLEEADVVSLAETAINVANFENLKVEINKVLENTTGTWSVYVKDLSTENTISINNQPIYAASLIKLFVMESAFANMDSLLQNGNGENTIADTLNAMITVSDNNAYNNLVSMHSASGSFIEGCLRVNEYISGTAYENTGIFHTLHPCDSACFRTSTTRNYTTVEDCGNLLESIYDGTCVSEEVSEKMLSLLLQQQLTSKIPAGLPEGTKVANKTGETDATQHDAAIVFGPERDYILCIMSSDDGTAIYTIQEISALVYEYLE